MGKIHLHTIWNSKSLSLNEGSDEGSDEVDVSVKKYN
jgi:hypothetical protein